MINHSTVLNKLSHIETIPWDVPVPLSELAQIQTQSAGVSQHNSAFEEIMN